MHRLLMAAATLVISLSLGFTQEQEIKRNDVMPPPEGVWLKVNNPDELNQLNRRGALPGYIGSDWEYGESCTTKSGGTLTAIGISENRVLVLYKKEGERGNIIRCSTETISLISRDDWLAALEKSRKQSAERAAIEKDKAIIRELLNQYRR